MFILREETSGAHRDIEYLAGKAAIQAANKAREQFPDGQSSLAVYRVNQRLNRWTRIYSV